MIFIKDSISKKFQKTNVPDPEDTSFWASWIRIRIREYFCWRLRLMYMCLPTLPVSTVPLISKKKLRKIFFFCRHLQRHWWKEQDSYSYPESSVRIRGSGSEQIFPDQEHFEKQNILCTDISGVLYGTYPSVLCTRVQVPVPYGTYLTTLVPNKP
jgi:hypothetical protein